MAVLRIFRDKNRHARAGKASGNRGANRLFLVLVVGLEPTSPAKGAGF
jgi:hypothetical protein